MFQKNMLKKDRKEIEMRKFNIIAIVTALAASILAGCGTSNTKIDFDHDHIIASIKDSNVKMNYATANTYVRIMQAETYDYAQKVMKDDETPSDDIWSEVLTEKTDTILKCSKNRIQMLYFREQ